MKIHLERFKSRFEQKGKKINFLTEDRSIEIIQFEEQNEKWIRENEQNQRDCEILSSELTNTLWDSLEDRSKKMGAESTFEEKMSKF